MVGPARPPHAALAAIMLTQVVPDLVQQHVEEHELPQGLARPGADRPPPFPRRPDGADRSDAACYRLPGRAGRLVVIHYFEGWSILDSGRPAPFQITQPDDRMELSLAPGVHHLAVIFADTPVPRAANALSLLTALLLLAPFTPLRRPRTNGR